ncbi:iron complex outermembrane receptor protein [Paraburkholderia caballeronis]|uniref:TonB-dependent siderophore receptor n=1 Tax=Paraburkholderia caballeronis TaxID=416943 RepID=UPI0010659AD3|nr:TonB-dependent receptor [Paraburkholderia caballeronis]TDV39165.1 iron complex outermembrane receptor protein [Paraburkholderia caballeronis]
MFFGWSQKTLACRVVWVAASTASAGLFAQTAINLPAQPLSTALSQLARERGVDILAPDGLVAGRSAPAVSGALTVPQALDHLLLGSGLTARQQDPRTFVIETSPPPRKEPGANAAPSVLPTITVTDSAAEPTRGFIAESTSTATRTDTPLSEIPQSVQVVTQDVITSQQAQSVGDVLRNVSSVTISNSGSTSIGGTPTIRGMSASVTLNGGMGLGSMADSALALPTVALASVEVLKGASAILAGAADPAGIVNVNLKRPQAERVRETTVQVGSYGDYMAALDLAGAVTDDKKLTYRFVVSGQRAGQDFTGHDGKRDFYLAPSVGWRSGDTDLVVGFEQHTARQAPPAWTFALADGPAPLTALSGRADDHLSVNSTSVYYDLKQKLTPALTFQSKARYYAEKSTYDAYSAIPIAMPGSDPLAIYVGYQDEFRGRSFDLDNNLQAKFNTGPINHTLLAGVAYSVSWFTARGSSGGMTFGTFPQSGMPPLNEVATTPAPSLSSDQHNFQNILYFQDQLRWGRLNVLASVSRGQAWSNTMASQSAWSPNLGVVYQLTDTVGLYANALRSFKPQNNVLLVGGAGAPPSTGRSVEAGVKLNLLDDRLTGSVSVFRAAQYNVPMGDPLHPGFSFLSTGIISRGIEADVAGRLMPGWNVIASYTYSNQPPTATNSFSQLPKHAVSLWTTYDLPGEALHGWGVGAGVLARSSYVSYDIDGNEHSIPGQARVDASVYYHARNWSATLGVKNLLNRTLYGDYATSLVEVLPGRLIYLTAVYDF